MDTLDMILDSIMDMVRMSLVVWYERHRDEIVEGGTGRKLRELPPAEIVARYNRFVSDAITPLGEGL